MKANIWIILSATAVISTMVMGCANQPNQPLAAKVAKDPIPVLPTPGAPVTTAKQSNPKTGKWILLAPAASEPSVITAKFQVGDETASWRGEYNVIFTVSGNDLLVKAYVKSQVTWDSDPKNPDPAAMAGPVECRYHCEPSTGLWTSLQADPEFMDINRPNLALANHVRYMSKIKDHVLAVIFTGEIGVSSVYDFNGKEETTVEPALHTKFPFNLILPIEAKLN